MKLPGVLAEIEALVGRDAALALAERLGGHSIHVPRSENLTSEHPLIVAIGADGLPVATRFAGESIYIPHARRQLVLWLTDRGMSSKEIAARLGVSPRAVRQHRSRARA